MTRYDWARTATIYYRHDAPGYTVINIPAPPFERPERRVMRWWRFDDDVYSGTALAGLGLDVMPEKLPAELLPVPDMPTGPARQERLL